MGVMDDMSKHSCLQNEYTCMKISDAATMIWSYMCNRKANHVGTSIKACCCNSDEYKKRHIRLKVLRNTLYRSRRCACLTTQGDHSRAKAIILKRSTSQIRMSWIPTDLSRSVCLTVTTVNNRPDGSFCPSTKFLTFKDQETKFQFLSVNIISSWGRIPYVYRQAMINDIFMMDTYTVEMFSLVFWCWGTGRCFWAYGEKTDRLYDALPKGFFRNAAITWHRVSRDLQWQLVESLPFKENFKIYSQKQASGREKRCSFQFFDFNVCWEFGWPDFCRKWHPSKNSLDAPCSQKKKLFYFQHIIWTET